jgi:serine protease AprX
MKIKNINTLLFLALLPSISYSQQKPAKYWIFFTDKGKTTARIEKSMSEAKRSFSEKALQRRAKVLPENQLIDVTDLPLYQPYLDSLQSHNIDIITQSRWLNAISVLLTREQMDTIKNWVFVKQIQPVQTFVKRELKNSEDNSVPKINLRADSYSLDYGLSLTQNAMMKVPEVHDMGINGAGVIIGMLDTGFDYEDHEVFMNMSVLLEYDFINNDLITRNEVGDPVGQHDHGTMALSTIGGYAEGKLIGPAYGAKYILAKTEILDQEIRTEEDYWVAGLEWLEESGVDIVSSSLGYNDWYHYSDMNGKTALTTIAADIAVTKGVVIVNSAGNEGNDTWRYIIAPADGFNVISVGAVQSSGARASFSSFGPTYDGRIKPEVVALGSNVYMATPGTSKVNYTKSSGTSFSCPLVAGVTALILSAHPELTPLQVREALKMTTDNATHPDNEIGWGLVNAYEAIFYHGFFFTGLRAVSTDEQGYKIQIKLFSKTNILADSVFIYYSMDKKSYQKTRLSPSSTSENNSYETYLPVQSLGNEIHLYFSAQDESKILKKYPYNAPQNYFIFNPTKWDTSIYQNNDKIPITSYVLYQNYPNPFNTSTTIKFDILTPGLVKIEIFNSTGQLVKGFPTRYYRAGSFSKIWDGTDNSGRPVGSGVYFYNLKAGDFIRTQKMLLLQ